MKLSILGKMLRALRQEKNWTAADLARNAGIDKSVVSRLEAGACRTAHDETLEALSKALGVPFDELKAAGYWPSEAVTNWGEQPSPSAPRA